MAFLFEISGIRLNVQVDNDKFTMMGVPDFLPSAMVDIPSKHGITDADGACFVTEAFMKLPEYIRNIALTHECGHVAMGHLDRPESQGDELVINDRLEAEADRWAAAIHGESAFDLMMFTLSHETLKAVMAKGVDGSKVRPVFEAEIEKRISNYKSI